MADGHHWLRREVRNHPGMHAHTVVIAYDGSDDGRRAVAAAAGLFPGCRAVVLHVAEAPAVPLVPALGPGAPVPPPEQAEPDPRWKDRALAVAREGCAAAQEAGMEAQADAAAAVSGVSGVASAILERADAHGADVIVVAAHARSRLLAVLLGSVCDAVVHRAHRPVLVVPADAP